MLAEKWTNKRRAKHNSPIDKDNEKNAAELN